MKCINQARNVNNRVLCMLGVLMLPLFLWLWDCSDSVSFFSLYHTLKMSLALQRIVFAFILYAWIKQYHFKRMNYFTFTYTWFIQALLWSHIIITSSIDAPYSYWQIRCHSILSVYLDESSWLLSISSSNI